MTQLMKERPWAVWCLFLAGAITGGIASALVQQPHVWAEPVDLNGQKFRELEQKVAAHVALLDGLSRSEGGALEFNVPVHAIELLVKCPEEATPGRLALKVCGPSLFTGDAGEETPLVAIDPLMLYPGKPDLEVKAPTRFSGNAVEGVPLVAIDPFTLIPGKPELEVRGPSKFTGDAGEDPLMVIMPEVHEGPALAIEGKTVLTLPPETPDSTEALSIVGSFRKAKISPYGIELLVRPDPEADPVVEASLITDDDVRSKLNVGRIDAETIRGESIEEYPEFGDMPPNEDPGPF